MTPGEKAKKLDVWVHSTLLIKWTLSNKVHSTLLEANVLLILDFVAILRNNTPLLQLKNSQAQRAILGPSWTWCCFHLPWVPSPSVNSPYSSLHHLSPFHLYILSQNANWDVISPPMWAHNGGTQATPIRCTLPEDALEQTQERNGESWGADTTPLKPPCFLTSSRRSCLHFLLLSESLLAFQ